MEEGVSLIERTLFLFAITSKLIRLMLSFL